MLVMEKSRHKAASYIHSKSERWEFRCPHSPVQHPSYYWPWYSVYVYGFVNPGGEPALQMMHHVICRVLDVSRSAARLRGLHGYDSQAPWTMQTAVLMLLPWCPPSRAWWALQSLQVCQIARSWFILTEHCDISAKQDLCCRHLSWVLPLLWQYVQEQQGCWTLSPCMMPACKGFWRAMVGHARAVCSKLLT